MKIDHDIAPYVVHRDESIAHALGKISRNGAGLIYCVSPGGHLESVLSDGDFRRWVVGQADIDLEKPVGEIANAALTSARVTDPAESVNALFTARIKSVPLLDETDRLVSIAWPETRQMSIAGHPIGPTHPTFVIAEIGNNHQGDLAEAFGLVDAAAEAGADAAKFQMRNMEALYRNAGNPTDASEDLGAQYTLDLLARFQLTNEELGSVFEHCRAKGLVPMCTPWDLPSLRELEEYDLPAYKIASADLTNHELVDAVAATGKPLILSTGMSTEAEILETVRLLERQGATFAVLHCNSSYPAPLRDVNLKYLERLSTLGDFQVGYSGHERGINVAVAAVAMGATVIEKHLTSDRAQEGSDHAASLLPGELREMVAAIREVTEALGSPGERQPTQGEILNREVLAKSLIAEVAIPAGTRISDSMVGTKSPGRGLQPNRRSALIGTTARRDIPAGDFFYDNDVGTERVAARDYSFSRPWGIPVRYHDWQELSSQTNATLLEFHMSYRDIELDPLEFLHDTVALGLVVHAPELFAGDHVIDLASPDAEYRERSIAELQRVIDVTRTLSTRFSNDGPPLVITNVGGFRSTRPWTEVPSLSTPNDSSTDSSHSTKMASR